MPKLETLKIGTFSKALTNTPLYVAKHFNWFNDEAALKGIKVELKEYNDLPAISSALAAKDLHLLFSAEIPAIVLSAKGDKIRVIKVSSTYTQRVLVQPESEIHRPADLRGKRVAVLQATSSHYCLLKILRSGGLTEKDVKISYMTPNEARAAFESKQLDGWAIWAPFGEQEEARGIGREISGEGALVHGTLEAPESFLREHSDAVEAFLRVIQKSKDWIVQNPEEAQAIVSEELKFDTSAVKKAWPKFSWNSQLTDDVLDDMQQKADFLAALDKTRQSKRVDVRNELIAPNYLPIKH